MAVICICRWCGNSYNDLYRGDIFFCSDACRDFAGKYIVEQDREQAKAEAEVRAAFGPFEATTDGA